MEKIIVRETDDVRDTVQVLLDIWKYVSDITVDKCLGRYRIKFVIEKIGD